jgi:hypothetical protein
VSSVVQVEVVEAQEEEVESSTSISPLSSV